MSYPKNSKVQFPTIFITIGCLITLSIFAGPAMGRDYDFSLTPVNETALKGNSGDMIDFYIDFKNEGDVDDSYMFYCGTVNPEMNMKWLSSGCFENVCWGDKTYQPVEYAAGESEHCHVQLMTPPDETGTVDSYLQVVSEATGTSKIVFVTTSTEENPAIRTMIYTNQDHYEDGDTLIVTLRNVNLGTEQIADTYVALLYESIFLFYTGTGELLADLAPYSTGILYNNGYAQDDVILTVPISAPFGIKYLNFASVMVQSGSLLNVISDISFAFVTFD